MTGFILCHAGERGTADGLGRAAEHDRALRFTLDQVGGSLGASSNAGG